MTNFVLVHGAWMGGWTWRDVERKLREAGHVVYTPTLTGLGERAHLARPDIDVETHVTDIVNLLVYEDLRDVVLVGHSYAAIVVQGVADRVPERLAGLVYIDSGPFPDGMGMLDFYSPEGRAATEQVVQEFGDGWRLPFPDVEDLGQQASLAGLDDAALALMTARATPQPFETFRQPLSLTREFDGEYARTMIACTDGGFTVDQLRGMIASGVPMFQSLAAPDWRFEDLPTGHWPMLSMPDELAALLERIAERPAPLT